MGNQWEIRQYQPHLLSSRYSLQIHLIPGKIRKDTSDDQQPCKPSTVESSDSSPASDSLKMESSPTDSTPCSLWYPLWLIALLALFGSAAAGAYNGVHAFLADVSAFQVDSNNLLHVLYHKPVTGGTICCKLFNCPIQAILSIFWWLVHAASWIWDCCTYSDCGYSTIRISAAIEF